MQTVFHQAQACSGCPFMDPPCSRVWRDAGKTPARRRMALQYSRLKFQRRNRLGPAPHGSVPWQESTVQRACDRSMQWPMRCKMNFAGKQLIVTNAHTRQPFLASACDWRCRSGLRPARYRADARSMRGRCGLVHVRAITVSSAARAVGPEVPLRSHPAPAGPRRPVRFPARWLCHREKQSRPVR